MSSLLKNRVFLVVLSADLLEQSAIWIRNMAILFYVIERTNQNPIAISLITFIEYAPILFFSFIGGTLADRWNPKKTILAGGLLSISSIIVIIVCISFGLWQAVFFATFISAIVSQFSQPSSSKIFKRHIPDEQVGAAIGIVQSLGSLFLIFGPIIGTAIYTKFGILVALYIIIGIFFFAFIITLFLPNDGKVQKAQETTFWIEIKEGFWYVWQHNNLKQVAIAFCILGFGVGLIQPLEVFLITDRIGLPKESVQWLASASGVGLLIGGAIAAVTVEKLSVKRISISAFIVIGVCTIMEVLSTSFWLTTSLRFLSAFVLAFLQIVLSTMMIKAVQEEFIGRTNGIIAPLFTGFLLLGVMLSGVILQATSLIFVFTLAGCILILAVWPARSLRQPSKVDTI